ncbi:phage tail protein [Serratia marcescens]|uniref:phage tail protein n=1 Tax=Serratia marcescens TaxID=615 RepID=UPI000CA33EF1|nr:phage tail protein [Serratia marcescens]AUO00343.1 phage tail protein [Serratia marcescens]TBU68495.1 phage tail protein [Serratia marcescens]
MPIYSSQLTAAGERKIAEAIANGTRLNITHMTVTDGETEMYRAEVNTLSVVEDGVLFVEMVIPENVGGFWIHGTAIYDDTGERIADGSLPATYKPMLEEGSGRISTVRMLLRVSSTEAVTLKVDPSVVLATVEYVNNQVRQAVQRANDAYELARQKVTFDEMYPIGDVKFFATFLNPNKQWPGTLWYYTGENKSIRIAKEDGSDVMGTGGADTVTLNVGNMPKHNHGVSGQVGEFDHGTRWASEFDHGTKWTSEGGEHAHQGGMVAPGEAWDGDYVVGSDNDSHRTRNWTSQNGKHSHTVDIGKHNHTVDIGKHSHSIEITSAEVGGGQAFSIVESHIKLMCWYRAA